MKNKFCLIFSTLLIVAGNVWAQKPKDIPVIITPTDSIDLPKNPILCPSVTLDGSVLTIGFPEATASQVVISDQNTNAVVYSDSFLSTLQIIIDLEDENIGEGNYVLRIYAFGKWWWGEFTIEEEY